MNTHARTRRDERGQVLIVATLLMTTILGLLALAVDAGLAYSQRSGAQNASDNAALAAAEVLAKTGSVGQAITAANEYAQRNGFTNGVAGVSVSVLNPPTTGPHSGDVRFFEVKIAKPSPNVFFRMLNGGSHTVGARAVAGINPGNVLPYNFVSLRDDCQQHTLLVDLGGTLTVNGGVYVNSGNGDLKGPGGVKVGCGNESKGGPGYGDGFDIFGVGGKITAQKMMVRGGWETHNNDLVCLPAGCCQPIGACTATPSINQPVLPDPLASLAAPDLTAYPAQHGSSGAPSALSISGGTQTLQPGIYYGGIKISGTASVTFSPGVYIMAGGGLSVTGSASLSADGSMIYNTRSSATPPAAGAFTAINLTTTGSVILKSPHVGPYAGLMIFQDRLATTNVILQPGNGINGLAGSIYAPGWKAASNSDMKCNKISTADTGSSTVVINASGTANVQIMSAQLLICAANATFSFDASGLAMAGLSLVE
jgi:hypothetical protein